MIADFAFKSPIARLAQKKRETMLRFVAKQNIIMVSNVRRISSQTPHSLPGDGISVPLHRHVLWGKLILKSAVGCVSSSTGSLNVAVACVSKKETLWQKGSIGVGGDVPNMCMRIRDTCAEKKRDIEGVCAKYARLGAFEQNKYEICCLMSGVCQNVVVDKLVPAPCTSNNSTGKNTYNNNTTGRLQAKGVSVGWVDRQQ